MKVSNAISFRVSKIVQKKQFVKDILKSIESLSGRVLLVGGGVRDLFLDMPIQDLDCEVYGLTLEQLEKLLQQYGTVSLIGKSFGVLRLHGLDVDWSLPRQDSAGRHPIVAYDPYMSYEQAFARRDLTINAMGIDLLTFELIDPFGGLYDLETKILRAPDLNFFAQDPLRLLRVMQFAGRFLMTVDEKLSDLCVNIDITKVSSERIEQEFAKLFIQAQQPSLGLHWLIKIHKFEELLPGLKNHLLLFKKLDIAAQENYQSDEEKLIIMWAIVVSFLQRPNIDVSSDQVSRVEQQPYIKFMQGMNHNERIIMQVVTCAVYVARFADHLTDIQLKWLALWLAPDISIRFLLRLYAILYDESKEHILVQAEQLGIADQSESPVLTGKNFLDVAAQGVQVGLLVKKAYQLQLDRGIRDRDELKKLALQDCR